MYKEHMQEHIDIVDEEGNVEFKTTKIESHMQGFLHFVGASLIFNSKDEILLTFSAPTRPDAGTYFHPSGGHIKSGEDLKDGAIRELTEEVGIQKPTEIELLGNFIHYREIGCHKENHFFWVYKVLWDGPIILGNEAINFRWFSKEELKEELQRNPDQFSDPLKESLKLFVFGNQR